MRAEVEQVDVRKHVLKLLVFYWRAIALRHAPVVKPDPLDGWVLAHEADYGA